MRYIRLISSNELTFSQRWATYLTVILTIVLIGFGINFRDRIIYRTTFYEDPTTGIRALYPVSWLIDTNTDEYIFRVRDVRDTGFKTTIQVSLIPVSSRTTERNVADQLALSRSQTFTDYRQLSLDTLTIRGIDAISVLYTYVSRDSNPFLESIPIVVIGTDIIFRNREQMIVITFRVDTDQYDAKLSYFNRFLNNLEF